jgi:hypothetical protein
MDSHFNGVTRKEWIPVTRFHGYKFFGNDTKSGRNDIINLRKFIKKRRWKQ